MSVVTAHRERQRSCPHLCKNALIRELIDYRSARRNNRPVPLQYGAPEIRLQLAESGLAEDVEKFRAFLPVVVSM